MTALRTGVRALPPEESFRRVFSRHYGAVYAYAARRVGWDDAPDSTSEVFTVAWRKFRSVPAEPDTLPWLYGVARKVVANHLRSQLSFEQQKTSLKATELNIETAVTRAGLDVQSTYKQLLAAQKSREAAERTLDAELTRFSVGMSTNFQVISLQNARTSARNSELSATIRFINAIAEFDRVQRIQ